MQSPPLNPPPPPSIDDDFRSTQPRAYLPDELILEIVEWCDLVRGARPVRLPHERDQTLAALCRLARRSRANAERVLYSRVDLSSS